jgi:hypothetical protein
MGNGLGAMVFIVAGIGLGYLLVTNRLKGIFSGAPQPANTNPVTPGLNLQTQPNGLLQIPLAGAPNPSAGYNWNPQTVTGSVFGTPNGAGTYAQPLHSAGVP